MSKTGETSVSPSETSDGSHRVGSFGDIFLSCLQRRPTLPPILISIKHPSDSLYLVECFAYKDPEI